MEWQAVVLFVAVALSVSYAQIPRNDAVDCKKQDEGTFSCYTCMGRDMENCEAGLTCCNTACFKLVDEKHSIIAKGCWSEETDHVQDIPKNGDVRNYVTDVHLPWSDDKSAVIQGIAYYCKEGEYCNSAIRPWAGFAVLISILAALTLR